MGKRRNNYKSVNHHNKKKTVYDEAPLCSDMHTHTIRSFDGELSVDRLLKQAKENNLYCVSITDHNNLDGAIKGVRLVKGEEKTDAPGVYAIKEEKYAGKWYVPGVEITCSDPESGTSFHLLVHAYDINNKPLQEKIKEIRKVERENYYAFFAVLEKNFGMKFSPAEIIRASVNNPYITWEAVAEMAVLHVDEKGNPAPYVSNVEEFMLNVHPLLNDAKYLYKKNKDLMIDVDYFGFDDIKKTPYPSLDDILPLIKQANGVPCIAHPSLIKFSKENIDNFTHDQNIDNFLSYYSKKINHLNMTSGLEVLCPANYLNEDFYYDMAKKYGMIASAGSDIHGIHKSVNHIIGTVKNKYFVTQIPYVNYLINGRKKEKVYYPRKIKDCYVEITKAYRKVYANKNQRILNLENLKKASNIQAVVEKFGDKPLLFNELTAKMRQIKGRNGLLRSERSFYLLLKEDEALLKQSTKAKDVCLENLEKLQTNYYHFKSILLNYNYQMEQLAKKDTIEHKTEFQKHLVKTYEKMNKEYERIIDLRKTTYKRFNINPLKLHKKETSSQVNTVNKAY